MEVNLKTLEYCVFCALIIVLSLIFRDEEPNEIQYKQPDISLEEFEKYPLIAWSAIDKRGDVCKIKYRVTNHNTRLWIYNYDTGELVHKQPFSRDPKLSDGTYRDFVYTWKLYHTEWTDSIGSGTYQIIVGGDFEPHSENGKVNILIDL